MLTIAPDRLLALGTRSLALLGGLALTATWGLAWVAPQYVILVPIAGLLVLLGMLVHDQPLVPLVVLIAASVVKVGQTEGVELQEVLWAGGVVIYLTIWYAHALLTGKRIVRSWVDQLWVLWLAWALIGGSVLGLIFGANPASYRLEIQNIFISLFYFPIKEAVRTERYALLAMLAASLFMGVWIAIANGLLFQESLASAESLWQLEHIRPRFGKYQLAFSVIIPLALATSVKRKWLVGLLLAIAVISIVGLLLTKYRGAWLATAGGLVLTWLTLPSNRTRMRMALQIAAGIGAISLSTLVILRERINLALISIGSRFESLQAGPDDISLQERFVEWSTVWEKIVVNPLVGYGWGVPFKFHSIIEHIEKQQAHVHNIILGILYKNGTIGLIVILAIVIATCIKLVLLAKKHHIPPFERISIVGFFGVFCSYILMALTSNPFLTLDEFFVVIITLSLSEGIFQYTKTYSARASGQRKHK